ncbi:MAG TPA: hypothetical protein VIK18_01270 [Pirellulales bacterium]
MTADAPVWFRLRWPREVAPEQVTQTFRLLATTGGAPIIMETVGVPAGVEHRVALPPNRAESVVAQLRASIPGLAVEEIGTRPAIAATRAVELRLSTRRRPLRTDDLPNATARPVGLNPLALEGRSPELAADQLLGLFHSLYAAHWGPRTHDILSASLLTLARSDGMSLAALPLLLTDAGFRRRVAPPVSDPIGLGPFWAAYEAWSEAERAAAIAPVMNKLRPLLLRPEMRAIVGQTRASFDLRRVFTERKILLVSLSKGLLGPETSALLGSLVVSQLWQAILGRAAVTPERRHPVFVYVDEFQDYMHLPLDFADALAQARSLGVGFVAAHQYMHQLDPAMRSAVLANAQSRIAFRLPSEDARIIAAGSAALVPEDFQSLGAFECYVQLVAEAAVQPWCSAATLLPNLPVSDPAAVRAASRSAYGVERAEIEGDLHKLFVGEHRTDGDDLTPRRRDVEASE